MWFHNLQIFKMQISKNDFIFIKKATLIQRGKLMNERTHESVLTVNNINKDSFLRIIYSLQK